MDPIVIIVGIVVVLFLAFFLFSGDGSEEVRGVVEEEPTGTGDTVLPGEEGSEVQNLNTETVNEEVSDSAPKVSKPTDVSGCVGWFNGDSWDEENNVWKDLSGQGNDATEITGTIESTSNDSSNNVKYVFGDATAGIKFPQACMTTGRKYTLFHVARYGQGSAFGRIFQGTTNDFVSGFYNGKIGGAHRSGSGWIAHNIERTRDPSFIVSTDQKHVFRLNGLHRSGATNYSANIPSQLTINDGDAANEKGDWEVAEVIFYRGELDLDQIRKVENYLMKKYRILKAIRPGVNMFNFADDGDDLERLNNMGAQCGEEGVMYFNRLVRHQDRIGRPLNRRQFDNSCIQGLEGSVDQKQTEYVNTSKPWREGWQTLMNLDCEGKGLGGYVFEEAANGSKVRTSYSCHSAPLSSRSCTDESVEINPAESNLNASLNDVQMNCGQKAMTRLRFVEEDGKYKYKYQCCNLEDM